MFILLLWVGHLQNILKMFCNIKSKYKWNSAIWSCQIGSHPKINLHILGMTNIFVFCLVFLWTKVRHPVRKVDMKPRWFPPFSLIDRSFLNDQYRVVHKDWPGTRGPRVTLKPFYSSHFVLWPQNATYREGFGTFLSTSTIC